MRVSTAARGNRSIITRRHPSARSANRRRAVSRRYFRCFHQLEFPVTSLTDRRSVFRTTCSSGAGRVIEGALRGLLGR